MGGGGLWRPMRKKSPINILKINEYCNQLVLNSISPGGVISVISQQQRFILPFGCLRYDQTDQVVTNKTIYDVASVTKAVITATIALKLIETGQLKLDEPISKHFPQLKLITQSTIKDLLSYQLSWNLRLSTLKDLPPHQLLKKILSAEQVELTDNRFTYANTSSILLGLLAEKITNTSLDQLARLIIFEPLGMQQSYFYSSTDPHRHQVAPTELDDWRGSEVCGLVHDESAWKLSRIISPGSAGLFSTVDDLLIYLDAVFIKCNYFNSNFVDFFSQNFSDDLSNQGALGWERNQSWMGVLPSELASRNVIGKTGFTGCSVCVDLDAKIGVVILTNAIYPHRPTDQSHILEMRQKVHEILWTNGM